MLRSATHLSITSETMKCEEQIRERRLACSSSGIRQQQRIVPPGSSTSEPSSNPSIEGTCSIWLRQLLPAPHVKR
jgi:hypothetical protein